MRKLKGHDTPVIIDLPQAVDAAGNNHTQRMLLRDVANLRDFFGQFAPELLTTRYGSESEIDDAIAENAARKLRMQAAAAAP